MVVFEEIFSLERDGLVEFSTESNEGSPGVVKKEKIIAFPNKVYLMDWHSFLFSPFLLNQRFGGFFPPSSGFPSLIIHWNVVLKEKEKKEKNGSPINTRYLEMW